MSKFSILNSEADLISARSLHDSKLGTDLYFVINLSYLNLCFFCSAKYLSNVLILCIFYVIL